MPNLDGYQATAQIRLGEGDIGARTRIAAMTADAISGDSEKFLDAGMDDYVAKPVPRAELKSASERCLLCHSSSLVKSNSVVSPGLVFRASGCCPY